MQDKKLRILSIGAHPDDCEFKTGGTAIKYRMLGHTVKFVSATNGNTGHFRMGGGELARVRADEFKRSCGIPGIEAWIFDINNNGIEADIPTREKFICLIREFMPDIIFTHRPNDYHPDHRRTSLLVQDSSFAVRIPNVCPLTPCLTYSPVILYMHDSFKNPVEFTPDIVVDIDDVMDTKVRMLHCHKSQVYEWLPWVDGILDQVPENEAYRLEWLRGRVEKRDMITAEYCRSKLAERYGPERKNSAKCAEAFEISEYGGKLTADMIGEYFPFKV